MSQVDIFTQLFTGILAFFCLLRLDGWIKYSWFLVFLPAILLGFTIATLGAAGAISQLRRVTIQKTVNTDFKDERREKIMGIYFLFPFFFFNAFLFLLGKKLDSVDSLEANLSYPGIR